MAQKANASSSPTSLNKMSSASIPLDGSGNPLPWSRDSIIQWARSNGFKKFIPAFHDTVDYEKGMDKE
ncbi:hypothetical protein H4217_005938 [Coemansia sp. RSA 1939]|nr:hypothetical protein H4217_005938 [Coemansia sp. RSA 1939]